MEPKKTIRFIDSHYEDKFRIPDGGKVEVTYPDGKTAERTCNYIDAYHLYFGSNVFHICELAERMESLGAAILSAFCIHADRNRIIRRTSFTGSFSAAARNVSPRPEEECGRSVGS